MNKRSNSGICSYHLCEKKTYVHKCRYCGGLFCKEHIRPKPSGTPRFDGTSHEDKMFMEDWHKPGGHPCPDYIEHWKRKKEWERDRYLNVLDRLKESKPRHYESDYDYSEGVPIPKSRMKEYHRINISKKLVWTIIVIFLLIGLVWYFNKNPESFQSVKEKIATFFNSSNIEKIKTEFSDVFKTEPERKEQCMATFNKLNQVRTNNGKTLITWDEKAYNLSVARAKDMYERNYFDHVTPEGKCVDDFKKDYGFSNLEFLAENAGGMSYYSKGNVAGNCDEALDSWLNSRGHRYNLLYTNHKSGAIGCYYEICVFLGVNRDGFGAKPCTTAQQGLSFWNTVAKQPGEV